MSDRDLRDLYENVRRGDEYVAPVQENSLYRNVYLEKKNIGGDLSDVVLLKAFKSRLALCDDNCRRKLLDFLSKDSKTHQEYKGNILESLLQSSGFESDGPLFKQIGSILMDFDLDWNELSKIPEINANVPLIAPKLTGARGELDLLSIFKERLNNIIIDPSMIDYRKKLPLNAERLYTLFFSTAFAESTVSVGKGELLLALFSDCSKGSVGDLMAKKAQSGAEVQDFKDDANLSVGNIQIELKTGKGRLISGRGSGFAAQNKAIEAAFNARTINGVPEVSKRAAEQGGITSNEQFANLLINLPGDKQGACAMDGHLKKMNFSAYIPEMITILNKYMPQLSHSQLDNNLYQSVDDHTPDPENPNFRDIEHDHKKADPYTDDIKIDIARNKILCATILYAYAAAGEHFQYVMCVLSGESTVKGQKVAMDGNLSKARYLDCSTLDGIVSAVWDGFIEIDRGGAGSARWVKGRWKNKNPDGEGIYISYPESNTSIETQKAVAL